MYNPIISALKMLNGNPETLYNDMLRNNPQFKNFVEQNKNKTPQQIAEENGIDYNQVLQLMNRR